MADNQPSTPADDAERIRLKRLAKLGNASPAPGSSSGTSTPATGPSTPAPAAPRPAQAVLTPTPRRVTPAAPPAAVATPPRRPFAPPAPLRLNIEQWQHETIGNVFNVTLDRDVADREHWNVVWLKGLADDLRASGSGSALRFDAEIADQVLISRLELDPNAMSDDPEVLQIVASLPTNQTVFEYLVGCWRRLNAIRSALAKKNYDKGDIAMTTPTLDKLRDLIVSYVGLTLQSPDMFPQPNRPVGHVELAEALLKMSSFGGPLLALSSDQMLLGPGDMEHFIADLGRRFDNDGLEDVLGPVVELVAWKNEALLRPTGLGGGDSGWRQVISALEALVSSKPIATMITRLPRWCPENLPAQVLELGCLFGPLLRLHVMPREWPHIWKTYFSDIEKRTKADVDSSNANLRATLVGLQSSMYQIFNAIVRSSPEGREGVLTFFSRVLNANWKRAGAYTHPNTIASDGFFLNIYAILLRFSEPFMDAKYSKLDRIDTTYLGRSSRVDVSQQTRLKGTSDDVTKWKETLPPQDAPPNFITEIFYLTAAYSHLGMQKAITNRDRLLKEYQKLRRELRDAEDVRQPGDENAIREMKEAIPIYLSQAYAMEVQLSDPDMVYRTLTYGGFTAAWLMRILDPAGTYPVQQITLPLPQEISPTFAMLPEYFVEDILDFSVNILTNTPEMLNPVATKEIFEFCLTFLTSTWYINNPYLRQKLVQILFTGTDAGAKYTSRSARSGVFSDLIISNPIALKHLMRTLIEFYIDVEITGTHSQFFEKFESRRNISHILEEIWEHPVHRQNLEDVSKSASFFTRFINLMMNDTTFVLDESIGKLGEIYEIEKEMENEEEWKARPETERNDKLAKLKQNEGNVPYWTQLADSNLGLFKRFTAQTRGPFVTGEIVERLAAMLAYNLDSMAGPRCGSLKVKDMEKRFRFKPRELLRELMRIILNLSEEVDFIRAIASEGRSYSKKTFGHAGAIAKRYVLLSDAELEQFALFIENVEQMKITILEEEDVGEIPDDFLGMWNGLGFHRGAHIHPFADPLMYTIMKEPVTLPSSHVNIDLATIKAHLLSDASDPFNRVPLKIEDVVPNLELKAQIQNFLQESRKKKSQPTTESEDQVMADA
ncbi:hypothetical protein EXIGLDRAFT_243210 [Exidia glandulosa HHB12029]|uniref:RING-type E3 ubiquitin transferase n=1 Tax=Exidia glandulosa HHB12029 TaxID=1314781 RepID=A0A165Q8F0_EXIGL|nr:hypothetical protein EXIGLDRAFT_243210 [Exidia glandulosa HHB12029]